ncbi:peptide ABC transporter substrate-binding protein [Sinomonas sp. JGH33]|uniref:Peptide ABC transporter substrate-binding protein n=1 Tax=Sinomonas terricola TaxID=3110330 RepID=A0ABU5TDW4_9MICC|nr:peptide ABC transporter substrate-binding protein [Sinomonas sp. JGH33]MEA5457281.1 peptide ABC transporter substrate-binding protein [Sinomonas sp. JGH33]
MKTRGSRRWRFAAAIAALAMVVATSACSFSGKTPGPDASQGGVLRISMIPVTTLDPAVAGNSSYGQILMLGLYEGLVVINKDDPLHVTEGAAKSWDISSDGLKYTFHLRDGARWSNGDPVTAEDFAWNFKRILTPGVAGKGTPSYNAQIGIKGAADFMTGASKDFSTVGVEAKDSSTLVLTLDRPNADFLVQLASYWALPLNPKAVEKNGTDWSQPKNWVSNGAYTLTNFTVNQGATLTKNDKYWDAKDYPITAVNVTFNDGGTTADLLAYQQDKLDITGRIEADLGAVTSSNVSAQLVSSPTNQVSQLVVMSSQNPVLTDVRVRQALAEAIDRNEVAKVAKPSVAGPSLVPAAVKQSPDFKAIPSDASHAKQLLAQAGYPDGKGMPTITLLDYQRTPWVEAVAQMWRDKLGINVTIDVQEVGVYGTKRAELHGPDYVGFYVQTGGFNPPTLLSNALTARGSAPAMDGVNMMSVEASKQYAQARAAGADAKALSAILDKGRLAENARVISLTDKALGETDPQKQLGLLVDAQTARNETYNTIPVLWGGYNLLVKPRVKNLKPWYYGSVYSLKGVTIEN